MTATAPEILPPPVERYTVLHWLKNNLFQNWFSGLVTIALSIFLLAVGQALLSWVLFEAQWAVVGENMKLLMVGQYPFSELWRIWIIMGLMGFFIGLTWGTWIRQSRTSALFIVGLPFLLALILPYGPSTRGAWVVVGLVTLAGYLLGRRYPRQMRRLAGFGWLALLPLIVVLVRGVGENSPMPRVTTNLWGGLLLTMLIGGIGILLSFPIGVVLAIGRRSNYPVIRAFCIVYIELIRAVPLITVLFMAQTMIPLFMPATVDIDRVVRAIIAFTLFSAAYMAENVRGGLQAIPKGQYEAAEAVGLNGFQSMRLIILPQALRSIIPILTASAIAGFRDTSLVLILGLLDLLGIAKATLAQPAFLGRHIEVYSFLAALYWAISYAISYVGQTIEARWGVSQQKN
jgi:general L-amino acid transport system permease protein